MTPLARKVQDAIEKVFREMATRSKRYHAKGPGAPKKPERLRIGKRVAWLRDAHDELKAARDKLKKAGLWFKKG